MAHIHFTEYEVANCAICRPAPPKTCNKHDDCEQADLLAEIEGEKKPYHCRSDDCEECFGC